MQNKRKVGRPEVKNPKNKRITVGFTEEEYIFLIEKAYKNGISVSKLIRKMLNF